MPAPHATFLVTAVTRCDLCAQAARGSRETFPESGESRSTVSRALRNHNLWLALAYVSLILLLTRTYA